MVDRITIGAAGTILDWDNWGKPITDAVNDHDVDIATLVANLGRGFLDYVDSATADAAHTAETVALTGASVTFVNGRCYEVEFAGNLTSASAANFVFARIRKTNAAGTLLSFHQFSLAVAGPQYYVYAKTRIKRIAGTDLTANICLTTQGSTGNLNFTGTASTDVRWLKITDCGSATLYPNVIAIT